MTGDLSPEMRALVAAHEGWHQTYAETVAIIGEGLFYATVCTSLDDAAVDAAMAARPSGTRGGWTRSRDTHFAGGQPNPCPCEEQPDARRHVLYEA